MAFDTTQYARPKQAVLMIFSDNKVYDGNMPIDPKHFSLQQQIMQYCDSASSPIPVFDVNLQNVEDTKDNEGLSEEETDEDESLIKQLCVKSGG